MSSRTGRPPKISLPEIVEAARRVVDTDGVAKLTMRRLAQELGSTPMAVYHHVRDKDELLVLLLDAYAEENMLKPELPDDPRERVVLAARAMHDSLVRVSWVVEVITADDLMSESALWYVENIVDGAMACGLTAEQAVHAYRAIWYYVAGEIIIHRKASRRRAADDRPTYRDRVFAELDGADYPRLAEVGARWGELTAQDTFETGLRALVNGLIT
ncbi:TetR/AcrR family transcriptional regulator C-terminal domain-containing protein [Actinomadura barringtoniae]|uniref:TetR/AcrR family transcriptional regulator C-terminal domain-containing protein n=1 Tax=Actinomadura barringtoniae TaxID=1427535 RepID=A0A939PPH0_9ACTN|nr:TetR/AcrR family transcriptional regulator [Actinomadura barringtoniae]MBO2453734.1 TetR/AcrR family transcriptional regulator C-terminal domain-containing protein [Actinomadura barringtoniae]